MTPFADTQYPFYRAAVRARVPRLLSMIDSDAFSKTFGSFDRLFWHHALRDFSSARMQELVYALAAAYVDGRDDNPYYHHPDIHAAIEAGMRYWQKLQHANGAFDNTYAFEYGYAATASTSFYIGEAFALLGEHMDPGLKSSLIRSLRRAGDWMIRNDDAQAFSTLATGTAIAALTVISDLCSDDKYARHAASLLDHIYAHQSLEGWYDESGGADPALQTHAMFYLARTWQRTGNARLLESLRRGAEFLHAMLNPDGSCGGVYASRNATLYCPAALEILAPHSPHAANIANTMRTAVVTGKTPGPDTVDTFDFVSLMNNYAFSAAHALDLADVADIPAPTSDGTVIFEEAGLILHRTPHYQAVFSPSKGGVLQAWPVNKNTAPLSDCGYWAKRADGDVISSQVFTASPVCRRLDDGYEIEAPFYPLAQHDARPFRSVALQLARLLAAPFPRAARWTNRICDALGLRRAKRTPLLLIRRVQFTATHIIVQDVISPLKPVTVSMLAREAFFCAARDGAPHYASLSAVSPLPVSFTDLNASLPLALGQDITFTYQWAATRS